MPQRAKRGGMDDQMRPFSSESDLAAPAVPGSKARRFLVATLGYSPAVVLPAVANFFFIVVFTRILGPVELGRYFLVVSVVTFSAVLLGTWFQQALLRFD